MKPTIALFVLSVLASPFYALADAVITGPTSVIVTQHAALDETTYYSITITPPAGVKPIGHAWLEFRADIAAKQIDGFADPVPILDVYALKQPLSGDPDSSEFESTMVPMSRPTAAGTNRLIRIDITEYFQRILAEPSTNYGIVLGPLMSDKRGIFDLKEDAFGPGVAARIQLVEKTE